jgi:glycerol-3-phosphate dehydrogenase (NAD(P)+)
MSLKIAVIGAGAWGTALAISASRHAAGHRVQLWTRDADAAKAMQSQRSNQRYLPEVDFPEALQCISSPDSELVTWAAKHDLIVIGTPMSALRGLLMNLKDMRVPVAWLCKGFEAASEGVGSGAMPHEVCRQVAPNLKSGALSGPSFALEVARAQPTALVAASAHASVQQILVDAFHSPSLRVYANEDIVGVEVGGAVKNVLAIATGLSDGLNLGLNARAALITRGLSEMTRLGVALGAKSETFMGLSGLGDLVLTSTGDLSRNRKVGMLLAQGMDLQQALQSLGHVAEGVYSALTVVKRAQDLGVDMPISQGVLALLDGKLNPSEAVAALMGRGAKGEN